MNILNDLIKDNKYYEARKYISQLHKEVERSSSVCYTGNSAVDSIINLKGDYARSHNIEFITKIKVNSVISTQLEYAVFSVTPLIMLLKPASVQKRMKNISALPWYQLDNKLIIEIENTSLPVDVNNLITSKKNKSAHGIGMQSIKQTVASMNGFFTCNYDNGYFSIKIVLNK